LCRSNQKIEQEIEGNGQILWKETTYQQENTCNKAQYNSYMLTDNAEPVSKKRTEGLKQIPQANPIPHISDCETMGRRNERIVLKKQNMKQLIHERIGNL